MTPIFGAMPDAASHVPADPRASTSPPLTIRELSAAVETFRQAERRRFSAPAQTDAPPPFLFAPRQTDFLRDELLLRGWVAARLGGFA